MKPLVILRGLEDIKEPHLQKHLIHAILAGPHHEHLDNRWCWGKGMKRPL